MSVQLRDGIYWVGAIDWNLRDFHGYITGRGATYNSYLILDEKITLIDTVKAPFLGEMLDRSGRSSIRQKSTISSATTSRRTTRAPLPSFTACSRT